MATNTSSPTPSEDNRQNNRDDCVYNALNKIMGNSVQSYDDFLNGFTYLKQGMSEKQSSKKNEGRKGDANRNKIMSLGEAVQSTVVDKKLLESCNPGQRVIPDYLEEEILSEGDTTSRIAKTKVIKTGALVQFDNFVDPVDDDDDDDDVEELGDLSTETYTASFTSGKPTESSPVMETEPNATLGKLATAALQWHDDLSNVENTQLSPDEKSTEQMLMNFLAELQNEMNVDELNEVTERKLSDSESKSTDSTDASMDIQNFLDKNKKSVVSEDVNFDDENDAIMLLEDKSEKGGIKVIINDQEFNRIAQSNNTGGEVRRARLDAIYRNTLMDSEGKVGPVRSDREMEENKVVENEIDPKDIVFPGQVEETNDQPGSENNRMLDFKATFRESSVDTCTWVKSSDLVQQFQLDEAFDYDNVILSPKFPSEDLQQLKMNLKPQAVVL